MHVPVQLEESLAFLGLRAGGVFLDTTCGMGGHAGEMARRLAKFDPPGRLMACDRDAESLEQARANLAGCTNVSFHTALFSQVGETLAAEGIAQLDGLLADLGMSSYQLAERERGFSFASEGPLDMRMSRSRGQTAADVVNYESEKALADLIYEFGEERRSRRISRAIVRARPITTTGQLAKLIELAVPRTGKLHPATQTFMALRIAVNEEMEELDALLESLPKVVKPGGRVVIISFHSLEDRKVKRRFQELAKEGRAQILTRHVVRPSEAEERGNPASRSAKLRAVQIL